MLNKWGQTTLALPEIELESSSSGGKSEKKEITIEYGNLRADCRRRWGKEIVKIRKHLDEGHRNLEATPKDQGYAMLHADGSDPKSLWSVQGPRFTPYV